MIEIKNAVRYTQKSGSRNEFYVTSTFLCLHLYPVYKNKRKIDDRMWKVIFGSCDKQEDKKYATKQERKFYLFRDDVFYHGALDEYLQCCSSYGCTEF